MAHLQTLGVIPSVEEYCAGLGLVNASATERLKYGNRLFFALYLVFDSTVYV